MILALGFVTMPVSAETLDGFRVRVEQAFAAPDKSQAITALFYLDGVDAEVRALYNDRTIPMLVRRPAKSVAFEELPADFRSGYVLNGYEYRPNLKPLGYIVLDGKTRAPYGQAGERFYFIGMNRTLVNANPPPEKTVQVVVFGFAAPPIRFSGSCQIMQSNGKTVTMEIEDNGHGNNTMALNAVHIESCTLTKLSGEGPLTMRILEADETVFEQQITQTGEPLVFTR